MAKKRKAEEQISGVPVNKRKSLLMKPRHYSPSLECKEESEDRSDLQEDISVLESSSTSGSRAVWFRLYMNSTEGTYETVFSKRIQNVFDF